MRLCSFLMARVPYRMECTIVEFFLSVLSIIEKKTHLIMQIEQNCLISQL